MFHVLSKRFAVRNQGEIPLKPTEKLKASWRDLVTTTWSESMHCKWFNRFCVQKNHWSATKNWPKSIKSWDFQELCVQNMFQKVLIQEVQIHNSNTNESKDGGFFRISFVQLGLQELMDIHETLRGAATYGFSQTFFRISEKGRGYWESDIVKIYRIQMIQW